MDVDPLFLLVITSELATGLEPIAFCLQGRCSTVELRQHYEIALENPVFARTDP
jgi:hypothetical protein